MTDITLSDLTALLKYREAKIDMGLMELGRWNQQNETIQREVNRLVSKIGVLQRDRNFNIQFVNCGFAQSQADKNQLVAYENDIVLFKSMKALLIRKWNKNLHLQAEHLRFLQSEQKFLLRMENFTRSALNLEKARDWDIHVETVEPDPDRHGVDESADGDEEDI